MKGDNVEQVGWDWFSGAFLDHPFLQGLRKAKDEEFFKLKQGKLSVKEYALIFQQLAHYSPELVCNMRSQI